MKNPTQVFGTTQGAFHYSWKEDPAANFASTQMSSGYQTFGSQLGSNQNIKKSNLAIPYPHGFSGELLSPVKQISGRGLSVEPPFDRPMVINQVVKPFKASSEIDRQRATAILDYIIERRKMIARRQEELAEAH